MGHKGELIFGTIEGEDVMCFRGRFHSYEGHDIKLCVLPVEVMAEMGVKVMFVSNAAGGLNQSFKVGDVMLMSDHIFIPGLAGKHPLVGHNDDRVGPRFPAMCDAYDVKLRKLAWHLAGQLNYQDWMHPEGVYAMVSGPSYETPAECRYLEGVGCDAVGMSTALEVVTAVHSGIRCLGFTLVSNECVLVPHSKPAPNHAEVVEAANIRSKQLQQLVKLMIKSLPQEEAILAKAHDPNEDKQTSLLATKYIKERGAELGVAGGAVPAGKSTEFYMAATALALSFAALAMVVKR